MPPLIPDQTLIESGMGLARGLDPRDIMVPGYLIQLGGCGTPLISSPLFSFCVYVTLKIGLPSPPLIIVTLDENGPLVQFSIALRVHCHLLSYCGCGGPFRGLSEIPCLFFPIFCNYCRDDDHFLNLYPPSNGLIGPAWV